MKNRNIKVSLTDEQYDFVKWIAGRDNVTISMAQHAASL